MPAKPRHLMAVGEPRADTLQTSASNTAAQGRSKFTGYRPGDSISNEQYWELYEWYPTGTLIELFSDMCWHAGLRNKAGDEVDLGDAKMFELQQWSLYKDVFGWAGILRYNDGTIQAWPPLVNNIGIQVPSEAELRGSFYDARGLPKRIRLYNGDPKNPQLIDKPNFFLKRTKRGLPGWMGSSMLCPLVALTLSQNKILEEYAYFAALVGRSRDVVRDPLAKTTAEMNATRDTFTTFRTGGYDCIVVGPEMNPNTDIAHYSGMEGSFNPVPILEFIDKLFCRALHMAMPMLSGLPEGNPSSSIMDLTALYARIKEYQDWELLQSREALIAFGAPADVRFNDPTELPIEQQATLIKDFIAALTTVQVDKDQIIKWINALMDTAFKRNEKQYENEMKVGGNTPFGNKMNTGGVASGANTGGKTPNPKNPVRKETTPKEEQGE